MTRAEIADHAAQQIMEDYEKHQLNFVLVKIVVLSALIDAANQDMERNIEAERKKLAEMRGSDASDA